MNTFIIEVSVVFLHYFSVPRLSFAIMPIFSCLPIMSLSRFFYLILLRVIYIGGECLMICVCSVSSSENFIICRHVFEISTFYCLTLLKIITIEFYVLQMILSSLQLAFIVWFLITNSLDHVLCSHCSSLEKRTLNWWIFIKSICLSGCQSQSSILLMAYMILFPLYSLLFLSTI